MPSLQRHFHRDFLLSCSAVPTDCGRFQSKVAITYMGSERTVSQRFIDLDIHDSEEQACQAAHSSGVEWIDIHVRR